MNFLGFYPIYRRELRSYVLSPPVYVLVALFFFMAGLIFYGIFENFSLLSANPEQRRILGFERLNFTTHVIGQYFWAVHFLMITVVPLLTMRLIAEEMKSGTFELLRSLPFSDWNIVWGKFLAAYTVVVLMTVLSGYLVFVMARFGAPEYPVLLVSYLGLLVAGAGYVAIGIFASSLTENQFVAGIVGFVLLLSLYLVGDLSAPGSEGIARFAEALGMRSHSEPFSRGLLRIEDVAYFLVVLVAFLFLTCRSLEARRSKQ